MIQGDEYQNLSTESEWLRTLTRTPVAFLEASLTWRELSTFCHRASSGFDRSYQSAGRSLAIMKNSALIVTRLEVWPPFVVLDGGQKAIEQGNRVGRQDRAKKRLSVTT